jgi:hypothetical protein
VIVNQALAELSKKGEVRFRGFGDYDPGMPGGQLNIFEPNGRQLRASVYMAYHKLYVTEAEAPPGDTSALLFEQSIYAHRSRRREHRSRQRHERDWQSVRLQAIGTTLPRPRHGGSSRHGPLLSPARHDSGKTWALWGNALPSRVLASL